MERLTRNGFDYCAEYCTRSSDCGFFKHEVPTPCGDAAIYNRLAEYEDTGLEPWEIAIVKNIVGKIATADYPHNFQRERSDIAAYMYWITSVMKDAKEWWNGMVTRGKEGDRKYVSRKTNGYNSDGV